MLLEQQSFYKAVETRYPGLITNIKRHVEKSERDFVSGGGGEGSGFLWEHSVLVASLAFRLAESVLETPWVAALTALLHDAGKFAGGRYHDDERPEEEGAARLARLVLGKAGLGLSVTGRIERALLTFYKSGGRRNGLADIIYDADYLAKSGYLGVANYFLKASLRGRNLEATVMDSLSKELTYAAALPLNMRTEAGRKLGEKKAKDTLRFHRAFLRELKEAHGLDFRVKTLDIPFLDAPGRRSKIFVVVPKVCMSCGGSWRFTFRTEEGVKCETLEATIACRACGDTRTLSFCLP